MSSGKPTANVIIIDITSYASENYHYMALRAKKNETLDLI